MNQLKILRYEVGQLQANCYFVIHENYCLIFDPGDSADFLLEEIQRKRLNVLALFASHGHFDHVMAAGEIQAALNIPFYIAKEDLFLLKRAGETARYFLGHEPHVVPPKETKDLREGGFKIDDLRFRIIRTPGHTPGARCFYFKSEKALFTGDTLFKNAIGRYDFSYSSKKDLTHSIKRLYQLPEETVVYPGHGEKTTIGVEKGRGIIENL